MRKSLVTLTSSWLDFQWSDGEEERIEDEEVQISKYFSLSIAAKGDVRSNIRSRYLSINLSIIYQSSINQWSRSEEIIDDKEERGNSCMSEIFEKEIWGRVHIHYIKTLLTYIQMCLTVSHLCLKVYKKAFILYINVKEWFYFAFNEKTSRKCVLNFIWITAFVNVLW